MTLNDVETFQVRTGGLLDFIVSSKEGHAGTISFMQDQQITVRVSPNGLYQIEIVPLQGFFA